MSQPVHAAPFLISPRLTALSGVAHGFFGRHGGVSEGIYESLNAGPGSKDASGAVAENRRRALAALHIPAAELLTLYQVHSADALIVDASWRGARPQADALVTDRPGIALGVLAADCMPFLLADAEAGVIAAAHAGWRGALAGVLESTVDKMRALGAAPARIVAALGPCLRQPNFEVGLDLLDAFTEKYPESVRFFGPGANAGKRQLDLAGFGAWRLSACGVTALDDAGVCTLADPTEHFSYRASQRAGEADYGRNLSVIALTDKG